jgi:hypothetical protein
MKRVFAVIGAVAILAVIAVQFQTTAALRREIASLRAELTDTSGTASELQPVTTGHPQPSGTVGPRLARLESIVADLSRIADHLVERGNVPPSEGQLERLKSRFYDSASSDADRLRALRSLRRGGQFGDDLVLEALSWLQKATNSGTRRDLLQQLDGSTNAAMKEPLLKLLAGEQSSAIREELVDVLADFASDPAVEKSLWELALNDPDGDVREEAQDALTDGNITPERLAKFKEKALDANLPLEERLLGLRGLQEADANAPDVIAEMINIAQNADPVSKAKLFDAFDGMRDPSLMAPLVGGLQDPNPVVRENAVDALSSFATDPTIRQWLNHVLQNDADPRVKREAHEVLERALSRN